MSDSDALAAGVCWAAATRRAAFERLFANASVVRWSLVGSARGGARRAAALSAS